MEQLNQERRGMFDGLRVPFDLNMLVLAIACVAGYLGLMEFTQLLTKDPILTERLPGLWESIPLVGFLTGHDVGWKPVTSFLVVVISLGFWTFFGTAIHRIAAMKIAREETLGIGEACGFAAKKFWPVFSSVVIVAAIFFVLYLVNSTFGLLARIPWLGEIIVSILFFLPLIFTFIFTLVMALGVFGFNLASAAIATESSDTWDGISRAWNYIIVRPWQVILTYGLTAVYLWVFVFFSGQFLAWSTNSLSIGAYGLGESAHVATRAKEDVPKALKDEGLADKKEYKFAVPGKAEFLRNYLAGAYEGEKTIRVRFAPGKDDSDRFVSDKEDIENLNRPMDVTDLIPGTMFLSGWIIWAWLWLCKLAMAGYALQYFFGATATLYFMLRKDVEGEEYNEIVVEEEELEDEAAWDVKEPTKAGAAPAGGLIMPKTLNAGAAPAPAAAAAPAAAPTPAAPAPTAPAALAAAAPAAPAAPAAAPSSEIK